MRAEDLGSRLRQLDPDADKLAEGCPDEHLIAAYVDATLEAGSRERFESHLADCGFCVALVGDLCRLREDGEAPAVPDLALARAQRFGKSRGVNQWLGRVSRTAAVAATVVLSMFVIVQFSQSPVPESELPNAIGDRVTRATPPATVPALQVIAPTTGATVDRGQFIVRWSGVPEARLYAVRIVSESGAIVAETRLSGVTHWRPSAELRLTPGSDYFVQVDAYLAEAQTTSSPHIPFTVAGVP